MSDPRFTVAGLTAFIMAQPAERFVNHYSWDTCAVADYILSVDPQFERAVIGHVSIDLHKEAGTALKSVASYLHVPVAAELTLLDALDDPYEYGLTGKRSIDTYGDIQRWITAEQPEPIESQEQS